MPRNKQLFDKKMAEEFVEESGLNQYLISKPKSKAQKKKIGRLKKKKRPRPPVEDDYKKSLPELIVVSTHLPKRRINWGKGE